MPALGPLLGLSPEQTDALVTDPTGSVRDAAIAEGGPFPVVVFSHGNGGVRFQSFFLTEYLASHGYIVVSPDHTGNAAVSSLPGGDLTGLLLPAGVLPNAVAVDPAYSFDLQGTDRLADVSFLVDSVIELNESDPDGRFTGKIDIENVGLTGHSFGGFTTVAAMVADDRFDVGAPMAGSPPTAAMDRPIMQFLATEDRTIGLTGNDVIEQQYQGHQGPKAILRFTDAGHFSFSNMCLLLPDNGDGCGTNTRLGTGETFSFLADTSVHEATNFYQTALYGFYLKGIEQYADDLTAEPFGEFVEIERDQMP